MKTKSPDQKRPTKKPPTRPQPVRAFTFETPEKEEPKKEVPTRVSGDETTESANGIPTAFAEDVMTLAEAAAFLRAPENEIRKMADAAKLPARRVAGEWRFLKSALCNWLSQPEPELSSKERMLAVAGAWKDDETFPDLIANIEANRKRSREREK